LQVRQVHIETLNNMREDVLDMYEMDGRRLDTRMIVATLLLAIGFGFVVEGTFPAPDPGGGSSKQALYQAQHAARIWYSVIAAFALLCPFWSLLLLMECRRRLDFFMDAFNDKFYSMLRRRFMSFADETRSAHVIHSSNLVTYTKGLPADPHPSLERLYDFGVGEGARPLRRARRLLGRCSRRRREPPDPEEEEEEDHEQPRRSQLGWYGPTPRTHTPGDFDVILQLHGHYATWWYDWCWRFFSVSSGCTWMAIICNVLCCSVLLGMYFHYNYPDTPEMWRAYSYLLAFGLAAAVLCQFCAQCVMGPRLPTVKLHARRKYLTQVPGGMPPWMDESAQHLLDPGQPLMQV